MSFGHRNKMIYLEKVFCSYFFSGKMKLINEFINTLLLKHMTQY